MDKPQQLRVSQLRAEIDILMRRVPPSYSQWSHGKSVNFKAFMARVKKALAKSSTTEAQLTSLISEYRNF